MNGREVADLLNYGKLAQTCQQIAQDRDAPWQTWTPTITWTTNIPIGISTMAMYKIIGKTLFFIIRVFATDGNNAGVNSYITLPVAPKNNGITGYVPSAAHVGSTIFTRLGYVRDDGTNNDLLINSPAFTAGSSLQLRVSGYYEIS